MTRKTHDLLYSKLDLTFDINYDNPAAATANSAAVTASPT